MKNELHSNKDYTGRKLTHTNGSEWDDTEVINSCFSQETPDTNVFPSDIKNVTFIRCNLDNVKIPDGCTVEGGSAKKFKVQNDMEDWIIDDDMKPVEPINKSLFVKLSLSIDPKDIPLAKCSVSVTQARFKELMDQLNAQKEELDVLATSWSK